MQLFNALLFKQTERKITFTNTCYINFLIYAILYVIWLLLPPFNLIKSSVYIKKSEVRSVSKMEQSEFQLTGSQTHTHTHTRAHYLLWMSYVL